ncbi:MAG: TIGR01548 family HAD-type hydrolase [Oscillatoriales cyanobacterium C42_A2020_001]|nr:TIGR01548 family HAD-type hydrolase [Leptolyngbyaceae cyanobacterium C42_A2020_001]
MIQSAIVVFDIDGVVRDVGNSYRRALADTVEYLTAGAFRPSQQDIDGLKSEGIWNNDWEASQEFVYRYFEAQELADRAAIADSTQAIVTPDPAGRGGVTVDYDRLVAFFQSRYRGTDPMHWNGYICEEPLLLEPDYLKLLTKAGIQWGFFSGATRGSATYVLEKRLGLQAPVLIAMEDAPGKPDPTGLFKTVQQLDTANANPPVLYVGDTVADMYTVQRARNQEAGRSWIAVGVLPPHVQITEERSQDYLATLEKAGADVVFWNVQELTPDKIWKLLEIQRQ